MMAWTRPLRRTERERGAAAVEFALIVPILLLLVFGIISYGFMLSFRQGISQGAAEAARAVAVLPPVGADQEATFRTSVDEALGSYGVTCDGTNLRHNGAPAGTCTLDVRNCGDGLGSECAFVELDYLYGANPLIPRFLVPLPENLRYTASAQVN